VGRAKMDGGVNSGMRYNDLEFFNVSELTKLEHFPGVRLNRFPENIRSAIERKTPVSFSRGCEIRFVFLDGGAAIAYLLAADEDGEALIFFGDYMCSRVALPKGIITPVHISFPELMKRDFDELNNKSRYSKNLCRIFLNNKAVVHFVGFESHHCKVAPPQAKDLPDKTWVAYGSSITHGAGASSNNNSYVQLCARLLKSQALNLGMSGACGCEKDIGDYIASLHNLDFVFLELGVNMRLGYTLEEFEKRVLYLIETIASKQKKVFVTTIYPNLQTYNKEGSIFEKEASYNEALRRIASKNKSGNVCLIEGTELLTNFSDLSADLLHPSDSGHINMGYNLYNKIKQLI